MTIRTDNVDEVFSASRRLVSILNRYIYEKLVDCLGEDWWTIGIYPNVTFKKYLSKSKNDELRLQSIDLYACVEIYSANRNRISIDPNIDDIFYDLLFSIKNIRNKIGHYGSADIPNYVRDDYLLKFVEIASYIDVEASREITDRQFKTINGIDFTKRYNNEAPTLKESSEYSTSPDSSAISNKNGNILDSSVDNPILKIDSPSVSDKYSNKNLNKNQDLDITDNDTITSVTNEDQNNDSTIDSSNTEYLWVKYSTESGKELFGCFKNNEFISEHASIDSDGMLHPLYDIREYSGLAYITYDYGWYYKGSVVGGLREGIGKTCFTDGYIAEEGIFYNDKFIGNVSCENEKFTNSTDSNIVWNVKIHKHNRLVYEGQFRNNSKNGFGKLYSEDNNVIEGFFCNDQYVGKRIVLFDEKDGQDYYLPRLSEYYGRILIERDGIDYSGEWSDGMIKGFGTFKADGNYTYQGYVYDGDPDG